MKKEFSLSILAALLLAVGCASNNDKVYNEGINIIPAPVELSMGEGFFDLADATGFHAPEAGDVASFFSKKIAASTGKEIALTDGGNISLILDKELGLPEEGYRLSVTEGGINVSAPGKAGLFYGMQTVMQLLPAEIDSPSKVRGIDLNIPCVEIRDYPRFDWRGFHVDPCRHFMTIEETKKQIDLLSEYKLNVMHWHLTDDQGWRIEIRKYPELTEVGAFRTEFDGTVHGGYYTQEEVADLVAYAAERFITVVPEIEMPGHSVAAIRAMPELSCEGKQMKDFYTWGTSNVVLCPGNEFVFEYLDNVVREVAALFPTEYFHIGGDECLKDKWEACPKCQERIKELKLKDEKDYSSEEKLQTYAVQRMERILWKYGKKLIGWDEILSDELSSKDIIMSWRGEEGGISAAKAGREVIMTPQDYLYFDHYQGDQKAEPIAFGKYTPLEEIYNYNPVPYELDSLGLGHLVLGVQGNTWSEYIYSLEQRELRMYPRAIALAEIAWSPESRKDFSDFCRRVDNACARLECRGINYHIPLPEQPGGSCDNLAFTDSIKVEFKTSRPVRMVYTIDGKEPKANSREYEHPFVFHDDAIIKIASVLPSGKMSPVRTVKLAKEKLMPASDVKEYESGLTLSMIYGNFVTLDDYLNAPEDAERKSIEISSLREMTSQEPWTRDMQDVRFFGSEAVGYIYIPEDGVWRFSTENDQLWIDGRLLIDNDGEVKKFCRNDAEMALAAGLHPVKVVFLSNIVGGWITSRNKGDIYFKSPEEKEFRTAKMYR